jgi:hypothetical protein
VSARTTLSFPAATHNRSQVGVHERRIGGQRSGGRSTPDSGPAGEPPWLRPRAITCRQPPSGKTSERCSFASDGRRPCSIFDPRWRAHFAECRFGGTDTACKGVNVLFVKTRLLKRHPADRAHSGAGSARARNLKALPSRLPQIAFYASDLGKGSRFVRMTAMHAMSSDWGAPFANSVTRPTTCSTTFCADSLRISRIACSRPFVPN